MLGGDFIQEDGFEGEDFPLEALEGEELGHLRLAHEAVAFALYGHIRRSDGPNVIFEFGAGDEDDGIA